MKKQKLVEKDYSRLLRKGKEESNEENGRLPKQGGESVNGKRRGEVTVKDHLASMGMADRERLLVRGSEHSILRDQASMATRKRESVGRKTMNRGKLQRDRNRVRSKRKLGLYTRIALKGVNENRMESLETQLNAIPNVQRRGIGRNSGKGEVRWFGDFESVESKGRYMEEKEREGRRSVLKGVRSEATKRNLVEELKAYYSMSRRKTLRMQGVRRTGLRGSSKESK
jgi:hypothetical protein